jgi:two-component system nitrate/nitrite response regulator NarL
MDREVKAVIRIAVIDNHHLFRDGVAETLSEAADFKVVAVGERGSDAAQIAQDVLPEIMLLDLNMPEGGIESAREISAICPYVKTVILTSCDTQEHLAAIEEAGARSQITKGVSGNALAESLRSVHRAHEPVLDEKCARNAGDASACSGITMRASTAKLSERAPRRRRRPPSPANMRSNRANVSFAVNSRPAKTGPTSADLKHQLALKVT